MVLLDLEPAPDSMWTVSRRGQECPARCSSGSGQAPAMTQPVSRNFRKSLPGDLDCSVLQRECFRSRLVRFLECRRRASHPIECER